MLFWVTCPAWRTRGVTQSGEPVQAGAQATTLSPHPGWDPAVPDNTPDTPPASPEHPLTRYPRSGLVTVRSPLVTRRSELRCPAVTLSHARPRTCSMT